MKVIKNILAANNFIDSLYSVMAGEKSLDGKGKNVRLGPIYGFYDSILNT